MSRYIDADKARDNSTDPYVRIYLDSQPTADAALVVHAHWEIIEHWATNDADKVSETIYLRCSRCRRQIKEDRCHLTDLKAKYPYCNCGARMDEDGDNE